MRSTASVRIWGTDVGAVTWDSEQNLGFFQYFPEFNQMPVELSPITMPNSTKIYSFPSLNKESFKGLPGLLADSLPDKFGNKLIDQWLIRKGMTLAEFNPVNRLCYTGSRGMGALEFSPAENEFEEKSEAINISEMVELASAILSKRKGQKHLLVDGNDSINNQALTEILQIGTSAGGARAKAVISWNEKTNEVRSGQVKTDPNFEYWLIKFDGVSENSDKELADPKGYGRIEYAYFLMAKKAGIEMSQSRLLEENGRAHFMTRRFDRRSGGEKIHMQSLCAMSHYDFNQAGAYSYEQAFSVIRQVLSTENQQYALEQQFKRMVFNVINRNQDDHTKNIAFLMDKAGRWMLSPAFDVCYSYNPEGEWTSKHQMTLNGKREKFTIDDFIAVGKHANIKKSKVLKIIDQVKDASDRWPEFAEEAGVSEDRAHLIKSAMISLI